MTSSDWKPHDSVSGECLRCGYYYYTQNGFSTKTELKSLRTDYSFKKKIYTGKNRMEKW